MPVLELCLLSVLSVQEPDRQSPEQAPRVSVAAPAVVDPAAWLPPDTMAALVLQFGEDTSFDGLLARIAKLDKVGAMTQLEGGFTQALRPFGVTPGDLFQVARGGVALGLTGIRPGPEPEFVCVARLTEGDAALRTRFRQSAERVLRQNGAHGGVFGDFFVAASDKSALDAAVIATKQGKPRGLTTSEHYGSALAATPLSGSSALTVFVRPNALFDAIADVMPSQQRAGFARAGAALAMDELVRAMLRVDADSERIEVAACSSLPQGDSLVATLMGDPARLDENLADLVPAGATDFAFAGADFGACILGVLDVVRAVEPGAAIMADAMIQQFGRQADVEIVDEIFRGFTGRTVGFTLPSGSATLIGLEEPATFARAIENMLEAGQIPIRSTTVGGVRAYRLDGDDVPVPAAFAVLGNWLCVTEGEDTLTAVARQIGSPVTNPTAAAALRARLSGTVMLHSEPFTDSLMTSRRLAGEVVWTGSFGLRPSMTIATGAAPAAEATPEPAPPEQVAALQAAEADPESSSVVGLVTLAESEHPGVAARATWLLRQRESAPANAALAELATASAHAEVRVLAVHALLRAGDATFAGTAIDCLDDKDMRARTLAAQLLGRLRHAESAGPLLAMIASRAKIADNGAPSLDLQAALLALADLGSPQHLLPAATALDGCRAEDYGPALTFYFQSHSAKLDPADEATLLVAVLGHSALTLRRYAIGRLSELRDLTTVKALEGRLAVEGPELQPLITVALSQIRRQQPGNGEPSEAAAGEGIVARLEARWNALSANQRLLIGGLAGVCLLLVVAITFLIGRRRRARRVSDTAALVAPSEGHLEHLEAESQALAEAADDLIDDSSDSGEDADFQDSGYEDDEYVDDGEEDLQGVEDGELYGEPEQPVLQEGDSYRS